MDEDFALFIEDDVGHTDGDDFFAFSEFRGAEFHGPSDVVSLI